MSVSIPAQLREVQREIAMRRRVFPRWVETGRMTKAEAESRIAAMEAVAETLRGLMPRQESLL